MFSILLATAKPRLQGHERSAANSCQASENLSAVLQRCVGLPCFTTASAVANSALGGILDDQDIAGIDGWNVLLVDAGIEGGATAGIGGRQDNAIGKASRHQGAWCRCPPVGKSVSQFSTSDFVNTVSCEKIYPRCSRVVLTQPL